ncbi:MAG: NAD(P)-binding domain-containing protein [Saprospiraceae bacterium]|nr:NAD(P)-binding domain-containing protein [Saprospiraceae bacterium]
MEILFEKILIYGIVGLICLGIILYYLRALRLKSKAVEAKIAKAKEHGMYEPVSLHPVINPDLCIGSGACVQACPENDILGLRNGRAELINASQCVGHGACFHACPVQAISLCIGTEKRGVELPHVHQSFETNVPGVYIAGELGGMGLIKNSVEQGRQAMENIVKSMDPAEKAEYDVVIVGAGPAGISAALTAKKHKLKFVCLEQDTLGGTVYTFPRSKIVMTSPMELPLYGKVKLHETSKSELLQLWTTVLEKHDIHITENSKVEVITPEESGFTVTTKDGGQYHTRRVLLAIGRRGTPRKLNVPGEDLDKVAYRLLEPEHISGKRIIVVGGGDSAIEAALLLAEQNNVILSYRSGAFKRIKPGNSERIQLAIQKGLVQVEYNSNLVRITPETIELSTEDRGVITLKNDLVYIFAGGELPTKFLEKVGIGITKRFGYALLKHQKN